MVAIQINGSIKKFTTIPKSWGNVLCGYNTLDASVWEEAGFYDVVIPEYNLSTQKLGDIEWNTENSVFTYPIINKTWYQTVSQLKLDKIKGLKSIYNRKLSETDWYIIRAQEGTVTPENIINERTALRAECATKEDEINALTTKSSIVSYSL